MYKLFLTLRYLRKRRIAYFAIAAVTLCVAMVLIVLSVMQGFLDNVKTRARGLLGDVIVDNGDVNGFPLYQEFIDEIETWPEIEKATPVIYSMGLLRFPRTDQLSLVNVVGVRLEEVIEVNNFKNTLFYETHYPGSTTFAEQQQPLLHISGEAALDPDESTPIPWSLPDELASALAKSREAGVVDDQSAMTEERRRFEERGSPLPPGRFSSYLTFPQEPTPPHFAGQPLPGLIIGIDIIGERTSTATYRRYYSRGEEVSLTLLSVDPVGNVDTPQRVPFRYTDDSRTRIYEIDSKHVYAEFEYLQRLLRFDATELVGGGMAPARAQQIQIKTSGVATREAFDALTTRLESLYHGYRADPNYRLGQYERELVRRIRAETWEETQAGLIGPVENEKNLVTILFAIISLVAAVLVLCILYMIVLQKTRDIGVIKAIGGSSAGVALIFIAYGAAVGLVGGVLGSGLGYSVVVNVNNIENWLVEQRIMNRIWDPAVYSFDRIPDQVDPPTMIIIAVCAVAASTLGSVLAAWRAGTMHPVEALRHE